MISSLPAFWRGNGIARFAHALSIRGGSRPPRCAERLHRPRGSSREVLVRHGTGDLYILEEIFGTKIYEFPAGVHDQLPLPDVTVRVLDLGGHVAVFAAHHRDDCEPAPCRHPQ